MQETVWLCVEQGISRDVAGEAGDSDPGVHEVLDVCSERRGEDPFFPGCGKMDRNISPELFTEGGGKE